MVFTVGLVWLTGQKGAQERTVSIITAKRKRSGLTRGWVFCDMWPFLGTGAWIQPPQRFKIAYMEVLLTMYIISNIVS